MSADNGAPNAGIAHRRSSITQAALSNLFSRGPSNGNVPPIGSGNDSQGRRLSVSTIGLSGTSPTNSSSVFHNMRRGSVSTNGGSIDESAIEDDDGSMGNSRTAPTTPFTRRVSFGASSSNPRGYRPSGSPGSNGNNNPTSPPPPAQLSRRASMAKTPPTASAAWSTSNRRTSSVLSSSLPQASFTMNTRVPSDNGISRADQQGFNWSEQLRSRAESSVSGARPSFSFGSPPSNNTNTNNRAFHDRARSVSEMPQPPNQAPSPEVKQPRPKPDAFQERILKGDFYMD